MEVADARAGVGEDLKKAVIRYKANHKKFHQLKYSKYNDHIDADLKAALKAGDNKRDFFGGQAITDKTKTGILKVEALTYEDGEFGTTNKTKKEAARLYRPLIPIEAEILLKGKAGGGVKAPPGAGPVRVNWRFTDPKEDTAVQFPDVPADFGFPKMVAEGQSRYFPRMRVPGRAYFGCYRKGAGYRFREVNSGPGCRLQGSHS